MIKIYTDYNSLPQDSSNFLKNYSIFQSQYWAKFNSEFFKRKYWFIEVKNDKNEIELVSFIVKYDLPFGKSYLYSPCGPVFNLQDYYKKINKEYFSLYLDEVKNIAKKEKSIFFRIDPQIDFKSNINPIETRDYLYDFFINKFGFKISEEQKQPETTLVLDLNKTEDEILAQMAQKGRYNIKVAQKHDIKITKTKNPNSKELDRFFELTDQTTKRDGFFGNNKSYYQELLKNVDCAYLYSAWNNDKIIASAITTFCGEKAIYYYGASGNEDRNLMAPYLLQWQMIKDAKYEFGCLTYDFLGVAPEILNINNKYNILEGFKKYDFNTEQDAKMFVEKHKYNGITNFKTKFGGRYSLYQGAMDKIYNNFWYNLIVLTKSSRKFLRKIFRVKI
ncbi:MAG: peptidoglycan bridge formation glycyltransferase FemA/FemB family protein [Patescibacteria group bacterium]